MNRSIDRVPAAGPTHDSIQLKLLDTLVQKIIEALAENSCKVRVSDALKAIQLREKVAKKSEAEQIFWQMIEEIKAEGPPGSHPEFTPLQGQIQAAILPLRDSVKNAILPVKAITESFNSTRSEQARVTTRRMGKLLSPMGFVKAKTPEGRSAIIWDDDLLPPPTGQQNPAPTAGLNALPYDSPESTPAPIEAGIHPASSPQESKEVSGNSACRSGCPSGLQGDPALGERATRQSDEGPREGRDSPPDDLIQGLDVLPTNPPTPSPGKTRKVSLYPHIRKFIPALPR